MVKGGVCCERKYYSIGPRYYIFNSRGCMLAMA